MKPVITNIVFDVLQNTLHQEECLLRSKYISEYFLKPEIQSEIEFIFLIISHLVKVENNYMLEVCPHCLGKKFDLFSDFNNLFEDIS